MYQFFYIIIFFNRPIITLVVVGSKYQGHVSISTKHHASGYHSHIKVVPSIVTPNNLFRGKIYMDIYV